MLRSAMTSSQARIAESLETFYGAADRSSEGAMAGHAYKRSVDDLDSSFVRELVWMSTGLSFTGIPSRLILQDGPFRTTISEPMGKMCAYFPIVNEHIAKRNKKVTKFTFFPGHYLIHRSSWITTLQEVDSRKSSTNQVKIPLNCPKFVLFSFSFSCPLLFLFQAQQEHDECKEMFDMLNDQLIAELPQLLNLRVPYFDPSFEAMIRMQAKFAEEGYEKLSGVQRWVNDGWRYS